MSADSRDTLRRYCAAVCDDALADALVILGGGLSGTGAAAAHAASAFGLATTKRVSVGDGSSPTRCFFRRGGNARTVPSGSAMSPTLAWTVARPVSTRKAEKAPGAAAETHGHRSLFGSSRSTYRLIRTCHSRLLARVGP